MRRLLIAILLLASFTAITGTACGYGGGGGGGGGQGSPAPTY
jgi:hypothetical protein